MAIKLPDDLHTLYGLPLIRAYMDHVPANTVSGTHRWYYHFQTVRGQFSVASARYPEDRRLPVVNGLDNHHGGPEVVEGLVGKIVEDLRVVSDKELMLTLSDPKQPTRKIMVTLAVHPMRPKDKMVVRTTWMNQIQGPTDEATA